MTSASIGRTHDRWWAPWLFLAPALAVVVVFILFPFTNTLALSVTDATLLKPGQFIGADNFVRLWSDERFRIAMINSTLYVICVVPVMIAAPLVLAALVNGTTRILGFFRTAFYLPVVMSSVIVGLIWTNLLDQRGLINQLLGWLGAIDTPIGFLSDRWLTLISAMVVTVWTGLGYYMVIYLAAMANIDRSLYEAAAIDGAGPIRQFLHVTVPGVRSTSALIGLFSSVSAFRVFGEVYVLTGGTGGTGGQNTTITMLIQQEGTGLQAQTGYAGAISMVMFVVLGGLLAAQLWFQNRGGDK
ncbi:carbohydrate ABC transporter permease [Actinoplanes couchii]|uniref:ABC transporter permease n=1 Tax=Actinoplanes couchii TaxID=403638 RepID=A0ABQ3XE32_9ACTN|nr:sugar ABC transporter permease [Actinoplanes couchii]MDR6317268.1 multiple sugar transport system permease protein [Actinoplanes couchii]GID56762.1 ABC transporter permease [Actinoplanes couchii]